MSVVVLVWGDPKALVAKLVDAQDLKSWDSKGSCQFKSGPGHHLSSSSKLHDERIPPTVQALRITHCPNSLSPSFWPCLAAFFSSGTFRFPFKPLITLNGRNHIKAMCVKFLSLAFLIPNRWPHCILRHQNLKQVDLSDSSFF